jgi:CMP-N,N'-diacetyllegionaminic acid synthase
MIDGKSVLAIITARGGSKGVPGKNIMIVGGRPLIQWSIDAARAARYVDRLILSSDDTAIMEVARKGGCDVPFVRDAALATDTAFSVDVIADALQRVPSYDIVVLLQPTSPLRTAKDIDGTIALLMDSKAPACVSVREAEEHPYWTFKLGVDGKLTRFVEPDGGMPQRRQDLPQAWCLNGAVYAANVEWFLRNRTFLSPETVAFPMPAERSVDVDTFEDIEKVNRLIGNADRPSGVVR